MKIVRRAGANQPFPHVSVPDQSRNSAQNLYVLSGRGFGTDDQKEEADRLPIQRIEGDRGSGNAGGNWK